MSILQILINVIGTIIFVVWIGGMISWVKRGATFPRHIHVLATVLTCIGVGCLAFLFASGWFTWQAGILCLLLPSATTYFGWLWLFGPEHQDDSILR